MASIGVSRDYVELRGHSWYSFGAGASAVSELVGQAAALEYPALGLTDVSNLCGAMEFSQQCLAAGLQPITGVDLFLRESSGAVGPATLLAETGAGYANLCRLTSLAYARGGRRTPVLEAGFLEMHAEGVIALLGAPGSVLADLAERRQGAAAAELLLHYVSRLGRNSVFVEVQRHWAYGDRNRHRLLAELAARCGVGVAATNEVWYHCRERSRLHDALTAVRLNTSLTAARNQLKPNGHYRLKPPGVMANIFRDCPAAVLNTRRIAERCSDFRLPEYLQGRYAFPEIPVPAGWSAQSWLERLCREASARCYGRISQEVAARLEQELQLIAGHGLAGFFLVYHRIVELAREELPAAGRGGGEAPLEWLPPGRGRGSSVSMPVGYLIGLSHVDPLAYGLSLDRFLSAETAALPDIDLDFPRDLRERLIRRIIAEWGWDHAALTGMFPTYRVRGALRDLGKALGLPAAEMAALARRSESGRVAELAELPGFAGKARQPGWRALFPLAAQLEGFPRGLAQHPGGMLVSAVPLTDLTPVQPAAIDGRYIVQWDKDQVEDAGLLKIDLLALGALSQMQQAVRLAAVRTGREPDLSRIDYRDPEVFADLSRGDTVGVFQVESAAQQQTIVRMQPRDIYDLALEVAAVRPGVVANDGVAEFLRRRSGAAWAYDHPLERGALERSLGVILFQDQVVQLGMDVGGLTAAEADRMRRSFGRRDGAAAVAEYRRRFMAGAELRGVPPEAAARIFARFNPHYMFPEGHALAFAFTAYQMAWLRRHFPLEFYLALFNEQPMGFWDPDTLKQDARRLGLRVARPCVNRSELVCTAEGADMLRLGLTSVKGIDRRQGARLLAARREVGEFVGLSDLLARSGLSREALENLARCGGLAGLPDSSDRRETLWRLGAGYRAEGRRGQLALPSEGPAAPAGLAPWSRAESMLAEYELLGLCPDRQIMELLRPGLEDEVLTSEALEGCAEGELVKVAGRVVRRQRPLAKAVFLTLEDEWGLIPVTVWEQRWRRLRAALRQPVVVVAGKVSRRDGTLSVVAERAWPLEGVGLLAGSARPDWR